MAQVNMSIDATIAACDSLLEWRRIHVAKRIATVIEANRRPFWRCTVLRRPALTYEQSEQRLRKQMRNGGACEMLMHPLHMAEHTGGYWEGVTKAIRRTAATARHDGATHITLSEKEADLLDGHWPK